MARAASVSKLRTRLLVLVLLAVAPALGAIVYSGYRANANAYTDARHEARTLNRNVAASFRRSSLEAKMLVSTLAQVPAVRDGSRAQCTRFIRRVLKNNPSFGNIGVIDHRGYIVCSAVPFTNPVYLGDRSYFKNALKTDKSVSGTFLIGRVIPIPLLVFAAPLPYSPNGRAVVYASMKLQWLNRIASDARLPSGSTLTVLDANRHVLVRYPGPNKWLGKAIPALNVLTVGLGGGGIAMENGTGPRGTRRLFSISVEPGIAGKPASYVFVGIPRAQVAGAGREAMLVSLVMLGVVTILLLNIGWFGSKRLILGRVEKLVSAAERLGKGDLKARAGLRGRDELARLGSAFDEMAGSLEVHSSNLESQVERIKRLNRIYRVLSGINGVILRVRDRDELLQHACNIAVELGDHPMAWIGLVSPDTDEVRLASHAGQCREMIESLTVSTDASRPEGRGTVGPALRSRRPSICNDVAGDPRMRPWRETLLRNNCRAVATFPLVTMDRVIGNFTLYADRAGYFDADEVKLFEEVAADTGLGMELIETSEQRDYLANHDPVTGLVNRHRFISDLDQAFRVLPADAPPSAVLAVQLVELDRVANHHGLYIADELRRRIAARLQSLLDSQDSLAVLGGSVFGIAMLPQRHLYRDPEELAERILALCPFEIDINGAGHVINLRVASAAAEPGVGAHEVVRNAEVALNALESTPDVKYLPYARQQDVQATRRYDIRQGLRRAIADGELDVVYQPCQDVRTGQYAGAEALLRWHSAQLGPVPPGEFIPIAEEEGVIGEIGAWVFKTVLGQILEWRSEGIRPGTISVNMSARDLQNSATMAMIEACIRNSGIDFRQSPMALEITETAVVQDFDNVSSALGELRKVGLETHLDDFGTGYSSLLYLQRTPLDALKIDLSFIRRIVDDPTSRALTRSSIHLARSLDLKVIAEGVETREQLEILRELGCDIAQGYFYSRPLPRDQFVRFIKGGPG